MNAESGLSRSELLEIDDDVDFVGTVIDDICYMDWPDEQNTEKLVAYFKALPHPKRVIWATWCLQAEVDNGGFGQYFTNIEDDCYVDEALDGLMTFGATEHRKILENVIAYRQAHAAEIAQASSLDEYNKIMGVVALHNALGDVGFQFIKRNSELYSLRRKYIMQHLDVFAPRP